MTASEEFFQQYTNYLISRNELEHWARERIEQLKTELDQEQRKAGQEIIERLTLIEKIKQLETELNAMSALAARQSRIISARGMELADCKTDYAQLEAEYVWLLSNMGLVERHAHSWMPSKHSGLLSYLHNFVQVETRKTPLKWIKKQKKLLHIK